MPPYPHHALPLFQLRIEDLEHEGTDVFLNAVKPHAAMREAVMASFRWLYDPETVPKTVRRILLVLKPMPGVAYTFGICPSEKEIHFSLDYIRKCQDRAHEEIMGVLVHEVVHCYQYNGEGTCPGGLIEGIADFVRMQANLSPPHWKKVPGKDWDEGYEKTAYFLKWIENRYGEGTIKELNGRMKEAQYRQQIFKELTGRPLHKLWAMYCKSFEGDNGLDNHILVDDEQW